MSYKPTFILLTKTDDKSLLLHVDSIESVEETKKGTEIETDSEALYTVKESVSCIHMRIKESF